MDTLTRTKYEFIIIKFINRYLCVLFFEVSAREKDFRHSATKTATFDTSVYVQKLQ